MPKDFSRLHIAVPDFHDADLLMMANAKIVVDDLVAMVEREEQPDGSPQKKNAPMTQLHKALVKGYTTPLKGASKESPYLARRSGVGFRRWLLDKYTVAITPSIRRLEIVRRLQKRGYWLMGITVEAERRIRIRVSQYFRGKIIEMARKSGVGIPPNG